MTNKEKIETLKKIRAGLEPSYWGGICRAYFNTTSKKPTEELLSEIRIYRPIGKGMREFWFSPTERKMVINEAIAHFESLEQPTPETLEAQKAELEKRIAEMKSDKIDLGSYYKCRTMYSIEHNGELLMRYINSNDTQLHYPSKHTAEKALLMIKLIQIAYMLNGGDWSAEFGQRGFVLIWHRRKMECVIEDCTGTSFGTPQFKTRELAERAKKQFTADELKKLLS